MKSRNSLRSILSLLVVACLFAGPVMAFGKKGNAHYKRGLQYEAAQQWEKAAQEFTLAVASDPSNTEYQLHYRRAVFNASQTFMKQGRSLAEQRDYLGAYNAFRQAFAYDPVNQLAVSEMERMLRLQGVKEGTNGGARSGSDGARSEGAAEGGTTPPAPSAARTQETVAPARPEQLRVINYSGDLKAFIRSLADQLNLNVIFDRQSFPQPRSIDVNLRDITTARALDYIFLQESLFFQKLDRRTILVADQQRRAQYQQLVLRTFYLANVNPEDAQRFVQQAIPASQGRPQAQVIIDKSTNSLTVRDTAENVALIGELIQAIDKDRAEVVMDVDIYEVSRNDLLQVGNQIGSPEAGKFPSLGGTSPLVTLLNGNRAGALQTFGGPTALAAALVIPPSSITALQSRSHTRLVASTQIHAFNGEESTARIGQRVPVQTASAFPFGFQTTTTSPTTQPFGAGGFPVINYEPTGLTLKFTPQVFPNLDVQVKMSIESKDVLGPQTNTPTFTERTITGTARIQNNRTMMLASVAQDRQSRGRQGLPLLGLLPLLGRLFTAPTKDNVQTDIVIAVTPRVLRAPAVTPRDEEMRPSGTLQSPTTGSLEAMLREAEREEQLIAARSIPKEVVVQLPDAPPPPAYVPASKVLVNNSATMAVAPAAEAAKGASAQGKDESPAGQGQGASSVSDSNPQSAIRNPQSVDVSTAVQSVIAPAAGLSTTVAGARQNGTVVPTAESLAPKSPPVGEIAVAAAASQSSTTSNPQSEIRIPQSGVAAGIVNLSLAPETVKLRAGEKRSLAVDLQSDAPLKQAVLALRFDPKAIKVSGVQAGGMFAAANPAPQITTKIDPAGLLLVSISPAPAGAPIASLGALLQIDIEAIGAGESDITFDGTRMHTVAADGRSLTLRLEQAHVIVKQ